MKSNIDINGDNNQVAGRDIVNNYSLDSFILHFNEEKLKEVIDKLDSLDFEAELSEINLERIDIEEKNEINNLTPSYFEYINDYSLPYFNKVESFLKNPL